MTRGERIAYAIEKAGMTPAGVARQLGCSSAAIYQWVNGTTKDIKNDLLFGLADLTGFSARWIATGEGPEITRYSSALVQHIVAVMEPLPLAEQTKLVRLVDAFVGPPASNHHHADTGKRSMEQ